MALIATISELIIPSDDHSPGAIAAEVPAFIDLMVGESPAETKKLWTDGLTAVDAKSMNNEALRESCANGHLEVVQWLTSTFQL